MSTGPEDLPDPVQKAMRRAFEEAVRPLMPKIDVTQVLKAAAPQFDPSKVFEQIMQNDPGTVELRGAFREVNRMLAARWGSNILVSVAASSDRLLTYEDFQDAVENTPEAQAAVDEATEQVLKEQPGLSRKVARRLAVLYSFVLYAAILMTLSMTYPDLMKLWLSAMGLNAMKLSELTGKAYDWAVPPEDET